MFEQAKSIPLCEWQRRLIVQNCITLSGRYWPVRDPQAYEYRCTLGCFISQPTYLVRFLNQDGTKIVAYNALGALPITLADFVKTPDFVQQVLTPDWHPDGPVHSAQLLVQYCSTCKRRAVIDGVHRLVYMASHGTINGDLYVTELAGPEWPRNMPDMSVICDCGRS